MTNEDAVERLITHLEKCPTWKFHALMRACALTGQLHVIPLFGLDPQVYLPPRDGAGPSGREQPQASAAGSSLKRKQDDSSEELTANAKKPSGSIPEKTAPRIHITELTTQDLHALQHQQQPQGHDTLQGESTQRQAGGACFTTSGQLRKGMLVFYCFKPLLHYAWILCWGIFNHFFCLT